MKTARLLLALLSFGCGASTPAPETTPPVEASSEGAALYAQYCALCHGAEGEGYAADNATRLRGQDLLRTGSDAFFETAIARGRPGTAMGGYIRDRGGPLDEVQVGELVQFIRAWQREPALDLPDTPIEGDAEHGAHLYETHCQACHGVLADGGTSAQSLNRWSFLSTVSDSFLRYAIEHGRPDTPMPAFGETLSDTEQNDLVAFLRAFEEEPNHLPEHLAPPPLADMPLLRHPDGDAPSFTLREGRYVPATEVLTALQAEQRFVLLDARATSDWLIRRIPGSLPVPYYMVTSRDPHDPDMAPLAARLPRDGTWIVAYCGCPHAASGAVMDALRELGFENTAVLDEGVYHWIDEGYPTEEGPLDSVDESAP
ncbi:MAG: c-type cytochrome [Sandaracinaceae bacterium]